MKLNRKWMLLVALVLSVAMATTGTLAYLTDEDADVNTMTLGKVEIVQNESQRVVNEDGTYKTDTIDGQTSYVLEEFEQDKPLLPIVGDPHKTDGITLGWDDTTVRMTQIGSYGSMQVFAGKNAVDKFVTVTNTGKSDAFVRTFVAIEIGSTDGSLIRTSYHSAWDSKEIGVITIDGNNYMVTEYSYPGAQLSDGTWRHEKGILPAGDTTYPSLAQVYLGSEADNEDVEAIDGNGNGKLDILVLSQAVQADGFEVHGAEVALNAGFGEPTATDAETGKTNIALWFGGLDADDIGSPGDKNETNNPPKKQNGDDDNVTFAAPADAVRVTSVAELEEAVNNGATTLLLAAGDYTDLTATAGKNLKLYGESKDTVLYTKYNGGEGADYDFDGSTVEFYNLTISADKYVSNGNYYPGYARMNGTYNDCVINGMYTLYGPSSFNYCTLNITGDQYNIWTWGAGTATFDHCTFNTDGKSILVYNSSCDLTVSNCVFNDSEELAPVKAAIETGSDSLSAIYHNIIVNNTDVNGFAINKTKCDEVSTTLWANKNGMDHDHLNVVVDGVDVY